MNRIFFTMAATLMLAAPAFAQQAPPPPVAELIVHVAAAHGKPVKDARLALKRDGDLYPSRPVSDGKGAYRFSALPPGDCTLTTEAEGHPRVHTELLLVPGRQEVKITLPEVAAGKREASPAPPGEKPPASGSAAAPPPGAGPAAPKPSVMNWQPNPPGAKSVLAGYLRAASGEPLPRAVLTLQRGGSIAAGPVETNAEGRYAFEGLEPGAGLLVAQAAGAVEVQEIALEPGSNGCNMVLGMDGTEDPSMPSVAGGKGGKPSLSGMVRAPSGEAAAGVSLSLRKEGGKEEPLAMTAAPDGAFRFDNLKPGKYVLAMTPPAGYQALEFAVSLGRGAVFMNLPLVKAKRPEPHGPPRPAIRGGRPVRQNRPS